MNIENKYLDINKMSRPGYVRKAVKKIVVHYVGNPNTTALANRNYFNNLKNQNNVYASSNYIVGLQGEIICCIPENEVAYHSGNLDMNYNSIGIENCHPEADGKFSDATYNSLIELCTDICKRYNLDPQDALIRHFDVTGKKCPLYYVDNVAEWEKIKIKVKKLLNENCNGEKGYVEYKIVKNDNLTKIAKQFNTTIDDIVRFNNIQNPNLIIAGNTLKIPTNQNMIERYIVTPAIGLNCRREPNVNSPKITAYKVNTILEISEQMNNWGKTSDGWVCMDYMRKV